MEKKEPWKSPGPCCFLLFVVCFFRYRPTPSGSRLCGLRGCGHGLGSLNVMVVVVHQYRHRPVPPGCVLCGWGHNLGSRQVVSVGCDGVKNAWCAFWIPVRIRCECRSGKSTGYSHYSRECKKLRWFFHFVHPPNPSSEEEMIASVYGYKPHFCSGSEESMKIYEERGRMNTLGDFSFASANREFGKESYSSNLSK